MLEKKCFCKKSKKNLSELAKRKDIAMISFEAEMVLKVWNGEIAGKDL